MEIYISKSPLKNKKLRVVINGKKIDFGGIRPNGVPYEDFTTHNDEERKQRYLQRHRKNEDWNDLYSSGYWAKSLLWNKTSLTSSIRDVEKKLNVKIQVV